MRPFGCPPGVSLALAGLLLPCGLIPSWGCGSPTARPARSAPPAAADAESTKSAGTNKPESPQPTVAAAPLPANFAAGVQRTRTLRDNLQAALAADDHQAAHAALHELARVLRALPALVDSAKLPESERRTALEAIDRLFRLFGRVDQYMHGAGGATYEEAAPDIDQALEQLDPSFGPRAR